MSNQPGNVQKMDYITVAEVAAGEQLQPGALQKVNFPNGIPAAELSSGVATDGQLPTADGSGNVAWENPQSLSKTLYQDMAVVSSPGGVVSLANPEGADVIVIRLLLHVTTPALAGNLDAGIAADGTTLSDNLIDGVAVGAAGVFDNIDDQGTNGESKQLWETSEFLTISEAAAGPLTNLVGYIVVEYIPAQ